jgi:hypothetical protein
MVAANPAANKLDAVTDIGIAGAPWCIGFLCGKFSQHFGLRGKRLPGERSPVIVITSSLGVVVAAVTVEAAAVRIRGHCSAEK